MARIPEEEIERLKREISLERLVAARGIALVRHGADLLGVRPFHDDREPSLVVSPKKNLWHCLGACQAGGTVIDWVMKANGVSFRHAVELLRADAALTVAGPTVRTLPPPVERAADDGALLKQVAGFYHETLKQSPEALEYLKKRGLESQEMIERFQLGFANRTLGLRLPAKNRQAGAEMRGRLQTLGIMRESGHEHFNGSIVIPVFDRAGNVTEMYGRKITDNLRTGTPLHLIHRQQREQQTLEGLLARRERDEILKVHRNAQRLLKPLFVANPYARELTFLDAQTRTRRDHGQIASLTDNALGQTVSYTYNALKRLTAASASGGTAWNQSYSYDGFGNLTSKSGSGATFMNSVDQTTNRLAFGNFCYDPNGNVVSDQNGGGCGNPNYGYDVANRMVSAVVSGGTERYYYTADNKRVSTISSAGVQTIFIYGAAGEKLAVVFGGGGSIFTGQITNNVYFAGRLIKQGTDSISGTQAYATNPDDAFVGIDRLGSVRKTQAGVTSYLPYGEELSGTGNDAVKFATYTRDGSTGLDYADQRYYSSGFGRFMSADRFARTASVIDSGSWNKYSYTRGDPVNRVDHRGTCDELLFDADSGDGSGGNGCDDDGGGGGGSICSSLGLVDAGGGQCVEPGGPSYGVNPPDSINKVYGRYNQGNTQQVTGAGQAAKALSNEISNLSTNCQTVLGGKVSLQRVADSLTFWDSRTYANVTVSTLVPGAYPGTFSSIVGESYAVDITTTSGGYTPNIDLGPNFFSASAGRQGLTLLHELLHVGLGANDRGIDSTFGIKPFYPGEDASKALTDWLSNDCKNK